MKNLKQTINFFIFLLFINYALSEDCQEGTGATSCRIAGPYIFETSQCECKACNDGGILVESSSGGPLECKDKSTLNEDIRQNLMKCKEINFSDQKTCANCQHGYRKSEASNNICKQERHVENCHEYKYDTKTEKFECESCAFGYGDIFDVEKNYSPLYEGACQPKCLGNKILDYDTELCKSPPHGLTSNCMTYIDYKNGTIKCKGCKPGYTLSTVNNVCEKCDLDHCAFCENPSTKCDECFLGYYLYKEKKCVKCIDGCPYCSNPKECDGYCDDGFDFKDGTCLKHHYASYISINIILMIILFFSIFN